ncbi:MAG: site-specific integrase [Candidatus Heimdallarchaeaceae archaeon]
MKDIPYYPRPKEIYDRLVSTEGWKYKTNMEFYRKRDKALISILYLTGLRISEALRLRKNQFVFLDDYIMVKSIKLSKSKVKGKPRRIQYRDARLPLKGERRPLSILVWDYLNILTEDERLFKFGRVRAWQIIQAYFPEWTCHWFRAFCEDYLYGRWEKDLLAVADYIKVDARTLQLYIRKRYEKYPVV